MAKPYRNKLNLFLTLNCHLELLGYLLFIYLFIYFGLLSLSWSSPCHFGGRWSHGQWFSFSFNNVYFWTFWLIIPLSQPNAAGQTSHRSHSRNCPETVHFGSLKADPESRLSPAPLAQCMEPRSGWAVNSSDPSCCPNCYTGTNSTQLRKSVHDVSFSTSNTPLSFKKPPEHGEDILLDF